MHRHLCLSPIPNPKSLKPLLLIMIYNHNKFFFDYMDIELMESSKNEVNLSIKGGDLGILYIVQNELLSDPKTEYAGVITRHPLTNELWMRVASTNPIKDILKATDSAIAEANKLKKLLTKKG